MANINISTSSFIGAAAGAAQVVALNDYSRRYIAFIAKTGPALLSFGEGTHATNAVELAEGNMMELAVNATNKVEFSTADSVLLVMQDFGSKRVLTSDGMVLTSDGEVLTYRPEFQPSPIPVFS